MVAGGGHSDAAALPHVAEIAAACRGGDGAEGAAPVGWWVKTQETPGEHQHRWQMDVHPPQNGSP